MNFKSQGKTQQNNQKQGEGRKQQRAEVNKPESELPGSDSWREDGEKWLGFILRETLLNKQTNKQNT